MNPRVMRAHKNQSGVLRRASPFETFFVGGLLGVLLMAVLQGTQERPWLWAVYGVLGVVYVVVSMLLPDPRTHGSESSEGSS